MKDLINWFIQNVGTICTAVCGLILTASLIVKLTPSTKDNEFLGKVINLLDKLSIAKTADDKKYIEDAKKHLEE